MNLLRLLPVLAVPVFSYCAASAAELVPLRSVFGITEENDAFAETDYHYTQGAQCTYLEAEDRLPRFMTNFFQWLPKLGFEESLGRAGLALGQKIYTPQDLSISTPQPNDRPYAGWLYLSMILQRRGPGWGNQPMQESLHLDMGVIGPGALGREAQNFAHETFDLGRSPAGWNTQLPNEPAFELKYARTLRPRLFVAGTFSGDLLPYAGFSVGNVNTSGRIGSTFRIGWNLPDDFGVQMLDSLTVTAGGNPRGGRAPVGFYFYAGAHGRAVAYNAFLDGTMFNDSQSIDKKTLVGDLVAGVVLSLGYLDGGFSFVRRSPEFVGQAGPDSFGSIFVRGKL